MFAVRHEGSTQVRECAAVVYPEDIRRNDPSGKKGGISRNDAGNGNNDK